jgi:hypothetical protein
MAVNDLPAARQLAGMAHHNHTIFCSCCQCQGRTNVHNTDFHKWKPKDVSVLHKQAEAWRDANTIDVRKKIYKDYGVRWSEVWRQDCWDPTRMLVPDPMHTNLHGDIAYHCRRVLQIDRDLAGKREPAAFAFKFDWLPIIPVTMKNAPAKVIPKQEGNRKKVPGLQRLLQRELDDSDSDADSDLGEDTAGNQAGDNDDNRDDNNNDNNDNDSSGGGMPQAKRRAQSDILTTELLRKKLSGYSKPVLVWVCWSLKLRAVRPKPPKPPGKPKITDEKWDALTWEESLYWNVTLKVALVETLINWVSCFLLIGN